MEERKCYEFPMIAVTYFETEEIMTDSVIELPMVPLGNTGDGK